MTAPAAAALLRGLAASRAVAAAALLACPSLVARSTAKPASSRPPAWIVRVLAGRVLLQTTVQGIHPSRLVGLGGACVDAAHATSLLPLLLNGSRYRRSAAASILEAGAAAVATYGCSRHLA